MENIVGGLIGGIHLVTAVLAMLFGSLVLFMAKGTRKHKQVGYLYVVSMLIMLVTSFMLYRLFRGFGIFHIASIFSALTLFGGMYPVIARKPDTNWIGHHFAFMYWSVVGLYAAFFSEVLTRVPETPFFWMVGVASGLTFIVGGFVFSKKKHEWYALYAKNA